MPTTVASTPKFARHMQQRLRRARVRVGVRPGAGLRALQERPIGEPVLGSGRPPRSRRATSACRRSASSVGRRTSCGGRARRTAPRRGRGSRGRRRRAARAWAADGTSGRVEARLGLPARGARRALAPHARRGAEPSRRVPERRRSAPSEAPVRKSTPNERQQDRRGSSAPVVPTPSATRRSSRSPTQPPCEEPSASISPTTVTLSPSRNGPTETSALRVTISAAERDQDDGRQVGGPADRAASAASGTGPAAESRTRARRRGRRPTASSPRPTSSALWWPCAPLRGASSRAQASSAAASRDAVLRRACAIAATSPRTAALLHWCLPPRANSSTESRAVDGV